MAETARAVADALVGDGEGEPRPVRNKDGYRSPELRERIAREVRWRDVPFEDDSDGRRIDPRALSIALDDLLPAERTVAVDSGNFMGYPSMYLSVPDEAGFCFTQAFQSIGLGLASAIGAAVARPDRLAVAALGDGGALMGVSELETVVRLGIPMVVVVYDDEAYGAEVHHFGPDGDPLDTVRFPPADIAAIGRGFGFEGVTVRTAGISARSASWLAGPREGRCSSTLRSPPPMGPGGWRRRSGATEARTHPGTASTRVPGRVPGYATAARSASLAPRSRPSGR